MLLFNLTIFNKVLCLRRHGIHIIRRLLRIEIWDLVGFISMLFRPYHFIKWKYTCYNKDYAGMQ